MSNRAVAIVLCLFQMLLLSGCWDQIQIEERGFVVGVAIDEPRTKEVQKKAEKEAPRKPKGPQRYLFTQQRVVPASMAIGSQRGSSQGTKRKAFYNIASEADSLFEASREIAARSSQAPFYQHLKVVVVSEQLAKSPIAFANSIDFFLRDPDFRRTSKILISKGEAKKILDMTPPTEKLPALYLHSLSENIPLNARMLPEVTLGDIHRHLINRSGFVIPRVTPAKNEVKLAGTAVFTPSNQLAGFLGEEETEGLNFLTGELKGGLLKAKVDENLILLNIHTATLRIDADVHDPQQLAFTFNILCEGVIPESIGSVNFMNDAQLHRLQHAFAQEIIRLSQDTINKVQTQMKVDVLHLDSYLNQHHHALWNTIKQDWHSGQRLFEKSKLSVQARVMIRNIGEVNRSWYK